MRAPRPYLRDLRSARFNPPDAYARGLPATRGVRATGDFPLAGRVGEAVADLEFHRREPVYDGRRGSGFFAGFGLVIVVLTAPAFESLTNYQRDDD